MKLRYRLLAYPSILVAACAIAYKSAPVFGDSLAGTFLFWLLILWVGYRALRRGLKAPSVGEKKSSEETPKTEQQKILEQRVKELPNPFRNVPLLYRSLLMLLWAVAVVVFSSNSLTLTIASVVILLCLTYLVRVFYGWSLSPYRSLLLAPWLEGIGEDMRLRSVADLILAVGHLSKRTKKASRFLARVMIHWYVGVYFAMLAIETVGFAFLYLGVEKILPGSFVTYDGKLLQTQETVSTLASLLEFSFQKFVPLGTASATATGWLPRFIAAWESLIGLAVSLFFVAMFMSQYPKAVDELEKAAQAVEQGQLWLHAHQPKKEQKDTRTEPKEARTIELQPGEFRTQELNEPRTGPESGVGSVSQIQDQARPRDDAAGNGPRSP